MAKTKEQKQQTMQELTRELKAAKSAVFANFQGLSMGDLGTLRTECRKAGIRCLATKKTLLKRALADAGYDVDTKAFAGGVAAFFGETDEVAPSKIVATFAKSHEIVTLFGGTLEGKFITAEKVVQLSKVPGKEQLLGQLVGTLNAPISGFVNVLAGNLRGLVTVLGAIKEQKA